MPDPRKARLFSLVLAGAGLVGCSSSDGGETSSTSGAAPTGACASDARKDIYTAGLTKPAGSFNVRLVDASPGPPVKGTNTLDLEILDAGGQPVDGATVTVTPFMPDHGHGSAVVPLVTSSGGGKYSVSKVYLAMAGLWKITVAVQMPGASIQEAAFQFCLDG